jgi:hypothetical protein
VITVRRALIVGWLILIMIVLLRRFDGAPQQAPIQTFNQVQVTDVYSER